MQLWTTTVIVLLLKLTVSSSRPVENKFLTLNVRNAGGPAASPLRPQWSPTTSTGRPEFAPKVSNESIIPSVKIVENYSVTNVEKNQVFFHTFS